MKRTSYTANVPIGTLDRRIKIQRATSSFSDTGAEETEWDDLRTVWAAYKTEKAGQSEDYEADKQTPIYLARFTVRKCAITEKDRIFYNGEVYDIIGISELDRGAFLSISTQKRIG